MCVSLLDPLSLQIWAWKRAKLTEEDKYQTLSLHVTPATPESGGQINIEFSVFSKTALK